MGRARRAYRGLCAGLGAVGLGIALYILLRNWPLSPADAAEVGSILVAAAVLIGYALWRNGG